MSVELVPQRYTYVTGGTVKERQRRRNIRWYLRTGAAVVIADAAGGWFLHIHNHLDIRSGLVAIGMFCGTLVVAATMVICWNVTANHELTHAHHARLRALELAADNVVPIRANPDTIAENTMVLPVVGRARPARPTPKPLRPAWPWDESKPGRQLSYTSGDNTIDCWIREGMEGDTRLT